MKKCAWKNHPCIALFVGVVLNAGCVGQPDLFDDFEDGDVDAPLVRPELTTSTPVGPAREPRPFLHGTATPGSTVQIVRGDFGTYAERGTVIATLQADESGNFFVQVDAPEGVTSTFWARAIDSSGQPSYTSSGLSYYVAEDAPPGLAFKGIKPSSRTSQNAVTLRGAADHGARVELFDNSTCQGKPLVPRPRGV